MQEGKALKVALPAATFVLSTSHPSLGGSPLLPLLDPEVLRQLMVHTLSVMDLTWKY